MRHSTGVGCDRAHRLVVTSTVSISTEFTDRTDFRITFKCHVLGCNLKSPPPELATNTQPLAPLSCSLCPLPPYPRPCPPLLLTLTMCDGRGDATGRSGGRVRGKLWHGRAQGMGRVRGSGRSGRGRFLWHIQVRGHSPGPSHKRFVF